jgi:hypothetical protein
MKPLIEYIRAHSLRSACSCGRCLTENSGTPPIPSSHTANLVFFKVALSQDSPPSAEALRKYITDHYQGVELPLDPLDGRRHNYQQLGAWIGDQGLAMQLMGMGALLDLWTLITPYTEFPELSTDTQRATTMAANGLLFIQSRP